MGFPAQKEVVSDSELDKRELVQQALEKSQDSQEDLVDDIVEDNLGQLDKKAHGGGGGGTTSKKKKKSQSGLPALQNEIFSEDEVLSEQDERAVKRRITKSKTALSLLSFFMPSGGEGSNNKIDQLKYLKEMKDLSLGEVWEQSDGLLGTLKNLVLWGGVKVFARTEYGQETFEFVEKAEVIQLQVDEKVDEAKEMMQAGQEKLEGSMGTVQTLRHNPEVSRENIKNQVSIFKQKFREATRETNPQKVKEMTAKAAEDLIKKGQKIDPKIFLEEVQSKKIPGVSLAKVGKLSVLRLTVDGLFESMQQEGGLENFFEVMQEPSMQQHIAEALIPVYGSWKSGHRMVDETDTTADLAKKVEFGINVLGDSLLVGGTAASFTGIGAVVGAPVALTGYGIKSLGTSIAKILVKSTAKLTTQFGTKKGLKESGEGAAKMVGKELKWRGLFEGGMLGAQTAYEKMFPEGVLAEVRSRAIDKIVTPKQKLYATGFGVALN